ncbi:MAG: hypothetical protein ACRDZO_14255 [Egibacteraceae bacterium]
MRADREAYLEQMRQTVAMTGQLRVTDMLVAALDELVRASAACTAPRPGDCNAYGNGGRDA